MYASNTVPCNGNINSKNNEHIPVETYENRAILQELTKRCESTNSTNEDKSCCHIDSKADNCSCGCHDESVRNNKQCSCKNNDQSKLLSQGIFSKLGVDDILIILLMILLFMDGNDCNDIMLPILLGVLLLT